MTDLQPLLTFSAATAGGREPYLPINGKFVSSNFDSESGIEQAGKQLTYQAIEGLWAR